MVILLRKLENAPLGFIICSLLHKIKLLCFQQHKLDISKCCPRMGSKILCPTSDYYMYFFTIGHCYTYCGPRGAASFSQPYNHKEPAPPPCSHSQGQIGTPPPTNPATSNPPRQPISAEAGHPGTAIHHEPAEMQVYARAPVRKRFTTPLQPEEIPMR